MLTRGHLCLITLVVCFVLVDASSVAQAADVPRVRLVATGGTFSNRAGGPLAAEDLPPLKARILLMLGLAVTSNPAEIQRMSSEY